MLLIFTDLDGTLLNSDDYRYDAALPVIERLKHHHIPMVPVTSKTRREVEVLCQDIGLQEPFITENGSGIFFHPTDHRFDLSSLESWNGYRLKRLGCTYADARQGLKTISAELGESLQGFGDLTVEEIQHHTGLDMAGAIRARDRDFTEPFITPKTIAKPRLEEGVRQAGLKVTVGDRFSHLIGIHAGKGHAVSYLIQAYRATHPNTPIKTIGLGNSPNDLAMLERVDVPIVIPGKKAPHPDLANRGWAIAPAAGSQGWAQTLTAILEEKLEEANYEC